jgi:hypothetical protein
MLRDYQQETTFGILEIDMNTTLVVVICFWLFIGFFDEICDFIAKIVKTFKE